MNRALFPYPPAQNPLFVILTQRGKSIKIETIMHRAAEAFAGFCCLEEDHHVLLSTARLLSGPPAGAVRHSQGDPSTGAFHPHIFKERRAGSRSGRPGRRDSGRSARAGRRGCRRPAGRRGKNGADPPGGAGTDPRPGGPSGYPPTYPFWTDYRTQCYPGRRARSGQSPERGCRASGAFRPL